MLAYHYPIFVQSTHSTEFVMADMLVNKGNKIGVGWIVYKKRMNVKIEEVLRKFFYAVKMF